AEKVRNSARENQRVLYRKSKSDYVNAIAEVGGRFDIVIIDGKYRPECARRLPEAIKEDGMVILDNSDRFKKTSKYIREELDLIQVDFHGFGPTNPFTTTTSIFFSRKVNLRPNSGELPCYAIGGLEHELGLEEDF
ncbi:MAG: SAM-dependent methyltransferase, partial [Methanobacteriota archaeon]